MFFLIFMRFMPLYLQDTRVMINATGAIKRCPHMNFKPHIEFFLAYKTDLWLSCQQRAAIAHVYSNARLLCLVSF